MFRLKVDMFKLEVNVPDLISEIRKLASEHPDNVYEKTDGLLCSYSRGTCTDGSRGCIFGQAFKRLGIDIPRKFDDRTIHGLLDGHNLGSTDELNWCNAVQLKQDTGWTWSNAVSYADRNYSLKTGV